MKTALAILTGLAMLGTLGVLFAGIVGGGASPARANALMRWRVLLQGAALGLFVLLLLVMRA